FMCKTYIAYFDSKGKYTVYQHPSKGNYYYSQKFIDAAKKSNVSPYFLASKSVLEVGKSSYNSTLYPGVGAGNSVNGKNASYPGIFNFYNIGASDGAGAVERGLKWASDPGNEKTYMRAWNTPGKSIEGGALYIGEKYINGGQDTTYFQRFNVKNDISHAPYTHQYMTSIYGNAAESYSTMKAYQSIGIMSTAKTFVIPVYDNMPGDKTTVVWGKESKTGVINANVNMRDGASTADEILVKLNTGDQVKILDGVMTSVSYSVKWLQNPYWFKIQVTKSGKKYTGYISANYVDVDKEYDVIKGVETPLPLKLSDKETVFYETDDPAIATVSDEGLVKGVKNGTTTIRAYTANGHFSATTVSVVSNGVVLDNTALKINRNATKILTPTVYPTSQSNSKLVWKSDNTKIATVSSKGKVTAVAVGKTVIHCKLENGGVEAACSVTVEEPVKSVSLNKSSVKIVMGDTFTLKEKIEPDNATNKTVVWSSDNNKVATVKEGVITTVAPGLAHVSVKTNSEGKTAVCEVKVVPKATTLTIKTREYDKVKLKWTAVQGATGYKIYRRTPGGKFELILTRKGTETTFIDTGLKTGKTYEYTVSGYAKIDNVKYVAPKCAAASIKVLPAKPKSVKVTLDGQKSCYITWKKVDGAHGYEVYRKKGKDGKYKLVKTISKGTTIKYKNSGLKKGEKYTYKLKSYKKVNNEKICSNYSISASVTR
ncbi:MAG: Ig-like domain-containing protein, partial [Lachnospiraceae bacterium]|nr:Ig-like domain-containing protein [Lachnospiraceae bacterium]